MASKKEKLDAFEAKISKAIERGEYEQLQNFAEEKVKYEEIAANTLKRLKKDKSISIRIASVDLDLLKQKAYEEGLPYQTLISSILHKYLRGRLVEEK